MNANRLTHLDYCQYLLVSQVNYTITNFAAHSHKNTSHDAINRYLRDTTLTPRLVWDSVREQIIFSENGYLVFDDSILNKDYSHKIQLVNKHIVEMLID